VRPPAPFAVRARDLRADEVPSLAWAGGPSHLDAVNAELRRREAGEVDYLAVCGPRDVPLGIGGVDHVRHEGAGTIYQLAVQPPLQSHGLGALLVRALEERVRARGAGRVMLLVGVDNPRARALYERLGYREAGTETDRWSYVDDTGRTVDVADECVLMMKELGSERGR
jgi:ribosomal protein S18 acetylase RimI-like enzyme